MVQAQQPQLSVHINWQQPMLTLSLSVSLPKLAKSAWQPGSCQLFCLQLAQERAGALMRKGCEKKKEREKTKQDQVVYTHRESPRSAAQTEPEKHICGAAPCMTRRHLWNDDLLGNLGGRLCVHLGERDSVRTER